MKWSFVNLRPVYPLWSILLLLHFVPAPLAVPTSNSTTIHSSVHLSVSTPSYNPTILPSRTTTHRFKPTHPPFITRTRSAKPTPTRNPSTQPHPHSHTRQTPIIIFFEALCGVIVLIVILGLLRCYFSYAKTPNQDRVSGIISRYQLQLELDELRRRPPIRRASLQDPAPPYLPYPPSYHELPLVGSQGPASNTGYDELPTASPPDSPEHSHTSLQVAHATVPSPNQGLPNG